MAVCFFVVDSRFEVGLYKAPKQLTARILNESIGSNVEVYDSFAEAEQAAAAVFDRHIYENRRLGLPTDDVERMKVDLLNGGESAVPSYG